VTGLGLQDLIVAALAVHAVTMVATIALARRPGSCRWAAFGGSALALVLATTAAASVLASGRPLAGVLFAHAASGIVLDYAVTPLSAWFLMVLGLVSIPIAVYSVGYLAHAVPPSRTAAVGAMFNLLLATVEVVFIVNNVIGFLFAWELMTLATAVLVATEHEAQISRRAAFLYLVMSHRAERRKCVTKVWESDRRGTLFTLISEIRLNGMARRGLKDNIATYSTCINKLLQRMPMNHRCGFTPHHIIQWVVSGLIMI